MRVCVRAWMGMWVGGWGGARRSRYPLTADRDGCGTGHARQRRSQSRGNGGERAGKGRESHGLDVVPTDGGEPEEEGACRDRLGSQ